MRLALPAAVTRAPHDAESRRACRRRRLQGQLQQHPCRLILSEQPRPQAGNEHAARGVGLSASSS